MKGGGSGNRQKSFHLAKNFMTSQTSEKDRKIDVGLTMYLNFTYNSLLFTLILHLPTSTNNAPKLKKYKGSWPVLFWLLVCIYFT